MAVHLQGRDDVRALVDRRRGRVRCVQDRLPRPPGPDPAPRPDGLDRWPETVALLVPGDQSPAGLSELDKIDRAAPGSSRHPAGLRSPPAGRSVLSRHRVRGRRIAPGPTETRTRPAPGGRPANRAPGRRRARSRPPSSRHPHQTRKCPDRGRRACLAAGFRRQADYSHGTARLHPGRHFSLHVAGADLTGARDRAGGSLVPGGDAFEMLSGVQPFTAGSGEPLLWRLSPPPAGATSRCSARWMAVVRIVSRLLQKDLDRRYRTALELARDLEAVTRQRRLLRRRRGPVGKPHSRQRARAVRAQSRGRWVLASLEAIARRRAAEMHRPLPLFIWSVSRGLVDSGPEDRSGVVDRGGTDSGARTRHLVPRGRALRVPRHPPARIARLDASHPRRRAGHAAHRQVTRLISPFYDAPPELEKEVHLSAFRLPGPDLLETLVDSVAANRFPGVPSSPSFGGARFGFSRG